jgi:hypothetical protein
VLVLRRRRRGPADQVRKKKKPGLVSRMIASPSPLSAFAVGVLLFAPGVTFLAAAQVIATARADIELTTLAVVISVLIDVALVWLPLVFFLLAPGLTAQRLKAFNGLAAGPRRRAARRGDRRGRCAHGLRRELRADHRQVTGRNPA